MTYAQATKLAKWYGCSTADIQKMIAHEDWCMWRKLEEKVMEDLPLWDAFLLQFHPIPKMRSIVKPYMNASLRTRCLALIQALDSLKSNDH